VDVIFLFYFEGQCKLNPAERMRHDEFIMQICATKPVTVSVGLTDILERRLPNGSTELPDVGSVDAVESRKV